MVTQSGQAFLEAVGQIDTGSAPHEACCPEQLLVNWQFYWNLFQALFSSQVRKQCKLCLSDVIFRPFVVL